MSKNKQDIVDKLLSELFIDKRENALHLVRGDFKSSAKKIITSHLDKIKDETEIPEA
tara:strand:+ start:184 stop:354 length:171 start_codon:yes stop_codon:yes gene_type:complete